MTMIFKAAALATASIAAIAVIPTVASAQAVGGAAVADSDKAIADTAAFASAIAQIKTTYAKEIAAVDARSKVLQGELQAAVTALQAAQKAPGANQAALQTQYNAIQTKQQGAQTELQRMSLPFERAKAYAAEQIALKLATAVKAVMAARNISLLVSPQATLLATPAADATAAITAELNKTVPSVSIAVPANWQPGQAAAAANPAAPAGR